MQNVHDMSAAERVAFEAFAALTGAEGVFGARLERHFTAFHGPLMRLYGDRLGDHLPAIARLMARIDAERDPQLRRLDFEREITPDWFQRPRQVGYICYVDRFGGTLEGVRERLPYLQELGVSYLHLMPLLRSREGPNDGGYAVADYRQVEPALGTLGDLRALAADLHGAGMSLCVDLVLNHTAREHEWARRAIAGEEATATSILTFEDRTQPDAYERTLPRVFPDLEPGNFTWSEELGRWVWTTFNRYQWDLDYANPAVFVAMLENLLELANTGVDVLRLDAVPFMWKRLGTDCQNQPEVHELLAAFRAITRVVAPGVIFKAEAIVSPHDLVAYLGECELAYHNSLMVLLWSALASRRASLMTQTLRAMPEIPPGRSWITYVRCHDDIGWAITEDNAAAVGEDAHEHRKFLVRFFSGDFWESFARGAVFQPELNGEGRTSGTAASLAGVAVALERGDEAALELACGGCSCCTASRSPTAACRWSTWATSSACATTTATRATRSRRPTTAGCTARTWTGLPPRAATTRPRSKAACSRGCASSSRRAAPARRCTPPGPWHRTTRATRTSSASAATTVATRCSCSRT